MKSKDTTAESPQAFWRTRHWMWGIVGLLVLGFAIPALAFGPRGFFGGPFGGGPDGEWSGEVTAETMLAHFERKAERILSKLEATDAQKQEVLATIRELAPQAAELANRGRAVRERYRQAVTAPNVDAAVLDQLRDESVALADDGLALLNTAMVRLSTVLTAEQRTALFDLMGKHRRGGPGKWGRGMGGSGDGPPPGPPRD